ncbi:hypothetical protein KIL84_008014 [Mauremys mutica]|uniref:Uncharacterized protein n=1 Tax=Mauremys mutica TaxID=74926 RepID=A0A9D4AXH6_9SAUR|nr:hypothetical protein KIL84_008014 [Mauremys mutica]
MLADQLHFLMQWSSTWCPLGHLCAPEYCPEDEHPPKCCREAASSRGVAAKMPLIFGGILAVTPLDDAACRRHFGGNAY